MNEKFLQKNINLFLIFLIIVMIGLVVMLSVYFEKRFEQVSGVYKFVNKNLSSCESQLSIAQKELNKIDTTLNSTESDIRKYDELYVTKSNELDRQKQGLENAQQALSLSEKNLAEFKAKYESETSRANTLQSDVNKFTIEVANLQDQINRKNQLINDLQDQCN